MLEIVLYLVLITLVSMLVGVLIGRLSVKSQLDAKVNAAYERAREELTAERTELAGELTEQLGKIRESILQSAHAYESAMQSVTQKLAVNTQPALINVGDELPEQLHLEFNGEKQEHDELDTLTDGRAEPTPEVETSDTEATTESAMKIAANS